MSRAHSVFFSTPMPTVICTPYFRRFNALLNFSRQLHTQKHAVHVAECPSNAAQPLRLLLVGSPVSITAYQGKNLDKTDKYECREVEREPSLNAFRKTFRLAIFPVVTVCERILPTKPPSD